MKTSLPSLLLLIASSTLASAVLTGCGKAKRDRDEGLEWSDTVGFQWDGGELPDTMPHAVEQEEVPRHVQDSLLDQQSAPPARQAPKRRSNDDYYDADDPESAAEEAAKERRMKKLNRDFDAGLYGEHTRGFDRDNYDPDLDDW